MKILGLIVIVVVCAIFAACVCVIVFGMFPWIVQTWRSINEKLRREEEERKAEEARKTAKVIPLQSGIYTYDRNRRLIIMTSYRAAKR
jgi:lipopolysaccharide export LptBFGC system permease protein LptF